MSVNTLTELLGVTRQAISQYETGEQTPRPELAAKLPAIFNLPSPFFFRTLPESQPGAVFYRSMAAATRLERSRAEQRHAWLKEIADYARTFVELPRPNIPVHDVPDPLSLTYRDIEAAATTIRRHWGLGDGAISDLVLLFENNGVIVTYGTLWTEHLDAFSEWDAGTPYVFAGSDKVSATRIRFDLAHELAHLVLHRGVTTQMLADKRVFLQLEEQAHDFAGAFLFPTEAFRAAFYSPSLEVLRALKPVWKISIQAMLMRADRLGLLSLTAKASLWRSLARRGWRTMEPLDRELPPERPRVLRRAVELLVQSGVQAKPEILAQLPFNALDIEELAGLDAGFFGVQTPSPRLLHLRPDHGIADAEGTAGFSSDESENSTSFRFRIRGGSRPLSDSSSRTLHMARKKDVHTVPNPDGGGWVNKVGGREVTQHQRKDTAVDRGRGIARQNQSEHVIHNADGKIARKNSYGNDPNPPKDKNR